ncbi:UNVERIFIED_CONTAM: hypothetical protein BEN50_11835 [Euhalothece sp. KZN 001]
MTKNSNDQLPSQPILDRAVKITRISVPNGEPYVPANGTEESVFESHWCLQCKHESQADGQCCSILMNADSGEQPSEWIYWKDKPLCTAFEQLD